MSQDLSNNNGLRCRIHLHSPCYLGKQKTYDYKRLSAAAAQLGYNETLPEKLSEAHSIVKNLAEERDTIWLDFWKDSSFHCLFKIGDPIPEDTAQVKVLDAEKLAENISLSASAYSDRETAWRKHFDLAMQVSEFTAKDGLRSPYTLGDPDDPKPGTFASVVTPARYLAETVEITDIDADQVIQAKSKKRALDTWSDAHKVTALSQQVRFYTSAKKHRNTLSLLISCLGSPEDAIKCLRRKDLSWSEFIRDVRLVGLSKLSHDDLMDRHNPKALASVTADERRKRVAQSVVSSLTQKQMKFSELSESVQNELLSHIHFIEVFLQNAVTEHAMNLASTNGENASTTV